MLELLFDRNVDILKCDDRGINHGFVLADSAQYPYSSYNLW